MNTTTVNSGRAALKGLAAKFLLLAMTLALLAALAPAQKGGRNGIDANTTAAKGGGGGGGGGGNPAPAPTPVPTPVPTPILNPLPVEAPAPGVILRESFGQADLWRPTGDKGKLKEDYVHTPLGTFWLEYPGNKTNQWLTPTEAEGQTWRFCGASDNPYEMFSPLQVTYANGCAASEWFDAVPQNPSALMPFRQPTVPYEITLNGWPAPIPGKYLALGLTSVAADYSALENSGSIVLVLKPAPPYMNWTVLYELRAGGLNGALLASGETFFDGGWNRMVLRYDPANKQVSASVNGMEMGPFSQTIAAPKYVGFEGVAIADNFVVRTLQ
jgi:hypothetical protein